MTISRSFSGLPNTSLLYWGNLLLLYPPFNSFNEFNKALHSVIKTDLQLFFTQLYLNQLNLSGINLAHIFLLPNKETPLELKDFRPISIVHSVPKLASKVLARRLQIQIPRLIHSLQSGFTKGHAIVENFAMAADMIQTSHKRKLPLVAL